MANNSPTIVAASLSDDQLKKSIDSLVSHVDEAMKKMVQSTNNAVGEMEAKLKSLGNLKIDSGGTNDGGASKRTKAQNAETEAVEKNVVARERQIKKNQEVAMSFDKMANAQQVAIRSASPSGIRNADTLQTMNIQLDLLRERLREARQQYSSFVALAAHATTTGDKGLFQYATDGVHRYEQEVRNLIPQIRGLQSSIQQIGDVIAPQGHTIQNYVNSLQKANPELAALNAQYKSGTSLLQDQSTSYASATQSAQRYTEEIRKQAQAIRESAEYKAGKNVLVTTPSGYDATINIKDRKSIEDKLTETYQKHIGQKSELDRIEQTDNEVAKERLGTETAITNEISKRKKYSAPETQVGYDVTRDKLVQIIATRNNIERNQVVNWDEQTSSIKTLSAALKQYQEAYVKMNATERDSHFGKQMIADMQVLERNIQKLRQQMARPIDFESVMNLPQKTLDDIAYKMRQLASYRSGLNVETQVKEIDQVNRKYAQLQKTMNDIMQKNTDMIASNTALGRSWNYMKNRLAFYFTVGASTSFVKNLIDIRSQYELLERSIGILFDSMQTGSKIFSELNQMAIKSPFTTMELGSAAKQLSAYNIAAKDVVDTTRRLADMAAAVGIPIERLTYALGQIKSYGYLNSRDARMFANAGIPLIQNLADMYTKLEGRLVSIGDVYDRIKKKQVSFEDTLKVVHEMTDEGGRFFNFQEKAADTLKVRLANLTLAWNNMLNNMGKSNQGVLTSGLGVLKEMFENWRKIENLVLAIATNFGIVKAIQLLILLNAKGVTKQMALQEVLGKRLGTTIYGIARNLKMLAINPMTWLTVAITAVTYLSWKFYDLTTANENFNKSIADGTKENIASIDKFFDKYRKDIESVGSMNTTDQEKMWERVREEIEKTTKNAQQYIDILEKIPELDKRVGKASGFLEKEKVIQDELNRLAQHGYFNIGGGFADDSYAETLTAIDKYTGEMIRKYGTYEDYIKAFKNEFQGFYDEFKDKKFTWNIAEEIDESVNHFKKLENLNWGRILSGGTDDEKLARIRDTFMSLRDNFFATEEMQNAGAEAQALYNRHMDYWITSIAKANGLIKELTVNGKTYSAEDIAAVEERRTEWELFFSYLSEEDRRTMDYLVKTNQTGGEEFKTIWNTMADSMKKSNAAAYRDLQKKIAELRETPDIVINVVYREMRDKLDKQQQDFEDRWIKPKNWSVRGLSAEDYLNEETANRTKYGRLMRKTEEDNVEWEERLGKEYQENAKKIKSLNAQLQNKNKLSEADREQKEKDLNLYTDLNKAITDIGKAENFNYDQFKKGGKGSKKDPLLDALKQEISLVEKLQSDYDKLSKSGASQADALDTIRGAYGKTTRLLNAQLGKYGLPQIDISQLITGKDPNKALAHFKQTLNALVSKGLLTLERSKELEAVVEKFTLSAKTYNLDMITKGLNNELGKLKDEYELAVELDANPEMGNMFTQMFGLDTSNFPKTINEYMQRVQNEFDKARMNLNLGTSLNVFKANTEQWYDWGKAVEYSKEQVDDFKKSFDGSIGVAKKWAQDTVKQTQDLQYKLADNNGKIAIEEEKLAVLRQRLAQETNEEQKRLLDLQIQDQQNAIAKLKEEILQMLPTYQRLFGEIAEHSAWMTRKLARDYKNMLIEGKNRGLNADNTYSVRDPISGQITRISKERMGKEIKNADKELQKTQSTIKKITEAFTKGEDGVVDWVHGVELVGEELSKLSNLVDVVGQIADAFSNPDEYNETAEAIHDISSSINGIATAAQGIGQFASGDYIGGAASILSGVFTTVSAWMDNSDKKIQQNIKVSERAVKRLELAYVDLEHAISNAYGTATIGAQRAAIANKELQLAELRRQLQLEQSRKSKNQDKERIIELQKQIKELEYDIKDATKELVNGLLGISSVGSAAEELVSSMISSFRMGEKFMDEYKQSFDNMIDNMIMKAIVGKVIGERLEKIFTEVEAKAKERAENIAVSHNYVYDTPNWIDDYTKTAKEWHDYLMKQYESGNYTEKGKEQIKRALDRVNKIMEESDTITPEDVKELKSMADGWKDNVKTEFQMWMDAFGIKFGQDSDKELSALQQGIQGITEDTAGALEAYMNGVSQQVYAQTEYLRQITEVMTEDANPDDDIEIASLSQILLQLQQSYTVQQSIQSILEGWSAPDNLAVRVQLV